jgi:hypothetical protein
MLRLHVWAGEDPGNLLLGKALIRSLLDRIEAEVGWTCPPEHAYLLEDLRDLGVALAPGVGEGEEWRRQTPAGSLPLDLAMGPVPRDGPDWPSRVAIFNRRLAEMGVAFALPERLAPVLELPYRDVEIRTEGVYVEDGEVRGCGDRLLDVRWLSETFRGLNFYWATDPGYRAHNVLDCSRFDLAVLSAIGDRCDLLLGTGGLAFLCSLTETNRFKPRALVGLPAGTAPGWGSAPGAPAQSLESRDDLLRVLVAVEQSPRLSLVHPRWRWP